MVRTSSRSAALAAKSKIITNEPEDAEIEVDETQLKKRTTKNAENESEFEDSEVEESEESQESETESLLSIQSSNMNSTNSKQKKKKKKLTYLPPFKHSWIDGRAFASFREMRVAMQEHDSATKRENRRFMTKLREASLDERVAIDESLLCKVIPEEETNTFAIPSVAMPCGKLLDLDTSNFEFDSVPMIHWCDCVACSEGPTQLLFLISPEQGIQVWSLRIDPQGGFTSSSWTWSHCQVPFRIDCCALKGGFLCLGSNELQLAKVLILSTATLHNTQSRFKLDGHAAITIPDCKLTALSMTSKGLLSGSGDGRVRLHSWPRLQECLQLPLPSAVPIYSILMTGDAETIVVAGRMNKVWSYSLVEGGDWRTEASQLGKILN